jgi:hypothetical protein
MSNRRSDSVKTAAVPQRETGARRANRWSAAPGRMLSPKAGNFVALSLGGVTTVI